MLLQFNIYRFGNIPYDNLFNELNIKYRMAISYITLFSNWYSTIYISIFFIKKTSKTHNYYNTINTIYFLICIGTVYLKQYIYMYI